MEQLSKLYDSDKNMQNLMGYINIENTCHDACKSGNLKLLEFIIKHFQYVGFPDRFNYIEYNTDRDLKIVEMVALNSCKYDKLEIFKYVENKYLDYDNLFNIALQNNSIKILHYIGEKYCDKLTKINLQTYLDLLIKSKFIDKFKNVIKNISIDNDQLKNIYRNLFNCPNYDMYTFLISENLIVDREFIIYEFKRLFLVLLYDNEYKRQNKILKILILLKNSFDIDYDVIRDDNKKYMRALKKVTNPVILEWLQNGCLLQTKMIKSANSSVY